MAGAETNDRPVRIALLASGSGTTAAMIMDSVGVGIDARVGLVISNNSGAGALAAARARGVPTLHLSGRTHPDPGDRDSAMAAALQSAETDLVVLAGYAKKVGPGVLARYAGKIINTHPSLLPSYGGQGMFGDHVYAAVLADGVAVTGASVHAVTEGYDEGEVLAQVTVPVHPDDDVASLRSRVQSAEKKLLITWLRERCGGPR